MVVPIIKQKGNSNIDCMPRTTVVAMTKTYDQGVGGPATMGFNPRAIPQLVPQLGEGFIPQLVSPPSPPPPPSKRGTNCLHMFI